VVILFSELDRPTIGIENMPLSEKKNKYWSLKQIRRLRVHSVLDVGAGAGEWGSMLRSSFDRDLKIDAVEVWTPYIERFLLCEKYDFVYNSDVREHTNWRYDLVIFGDVLEHMPLNDAVKCFRLASQQARYILVSIPTIPHPQDEHFGNPFEKHLIEDISVEGFIETFGKPSKFRTFPVTTVFIYKCASVPEQIIYSLGKYVPLKLKKLILGSKRQNFNYLQLR